MIILTYQRLLSVLYQAFAIGALTLVGQSYGANRHDHADHTTRQFFWIVGAVVLFISIIIFFRARYFIMLFTSDPAVLGVCTGVLKIAAVVQVPKALSFVCSYSLRGVGENRYPMYLAIVGVFVFEVALGFGLAFPLGMSLAGLWIALGVDEVFKVTMSLKRFNRRIVQLTT
jgi:Na+-driven multidrug efflux pump